MKLKSTFLFALATLTVAPNCMFAQAGSGIKVKDAVIMPYVRPFAMHDSNVLLDQDNEVDDTRLGLEYGVEASRVNGNSLVNVKAWGLTESYDDTSSLDHDDWGQSVDLVLRSKGGTQATLQQSYSDAEDIDYIIAAVQRVKQLGAALYLDREISPKTDAQVGAAYSSTDYASASFFDWKKILLSADADYEITKKTRLYLTGSVGELDGDGNTDEAIYYNALLGARSQQTGKVSGEVALGVMGAEDDVVSISDLSYEANLTWEALDKVSVSGSVDREIQPNVVRANDYTTISRVNADVVWECLKSIALTFSGTYQNFEAEAPTEAGQTKEEDVLIGEVRADYQAPQNWLKAYLSVKVSDQDSSVAGGDYTKEQVEAGLWLQY